MEELPGLCRRQRERFFTRIGRLARDELRMGRIGNDDGQPPIGGRERQVFMKRRERRNPVIDGFRRCAGDRQGIPVILDLGDRDQQKPRRFLRPKHPAMPDEGKNTIFIRAAGMEALGPVHPALEDIVHRRVEVLHPNLIPLCQRVRITGSDLE